MKPVYLSLLLLGCLALPSSAQADIVRLTTGENVFGQGWRFLDNDGTCKVATAKHVVVSADGVLMPTLAVDGKKRETSAGKPVYLSDDPALDIAVLSLPSQNDPLLCGSGRLSDIGIERRAHADKGLTIETTGQSEVVSVPVERRAERMDQHNGEIFAVAPLNPEDKFAKGWSGSVVRDSYGPIGIVFSVDPERNEANAVRIDAVRRLLAGKPISPTKAPPNAAAAETPQAEASPASATSLIGSTVDPDHGPDQIFGDDDAYWLVRPARKAVSFLVAFNALRPIHSVELRYKEKEDTLVSGIEIRTSASPTGDDWVPMGFCKASSDNKRQLSCPIIGATVQRVQVILSTSDNDPIKLSGWKTE